MSFRRLLLCIYVASFGVVSFANDLKTSNFFIRCDSNQDKQLTIKEITSCMRKYHDVSDLSFILNADSTQFLLLIDANNDNIIQLEEYLYFLDRHDQTRGQADDDDTITVKTRDGKVREMTKDEIKGKMSMSMEGVQRKGDKMFKEDSNSGKIDEIAKKNPEMGRFIKLGKWSHHILTQLNYVSEGSKITQLKSLPAGGTKTALLQKYNKYIEEEGVASVSDEVMMSFRSNFTTFLLLSVEDPPGSDTVINYELVVEYNPKLYRKPHLVIAEGWVLDADREVRESTLTFPPPRYRDQTIADAVRTIFTKLNGKYGEYTVLVYSILTCTVLLLSVVGLLYVCCAGAEPDITPAEEAHLDAVMLASRRGPSSVGAGEGGSGGKGGGSGRGKKTN